MFSQTVEYILRVVVFLAVREQSPSTTNQISGATQVPIGYLAKIMQRLGKSGLVKSQRRRNGGFVLAKSAYQLSLYDIIQGLEPIGRISRCPLNIPEHRTALCPLHARLDKAVAAVETTLREASIVDLMAQVNRCQTRRGSVAIAK